MDNRTLPSRRCGARAFGTFVAASATALALFGGTGDANAGGFALKEQSATALGNAFAGATAGAEDISYMFFNPAGLVRHEGNQAAAVLSYIAPQGETNDATTSPFVGGEASSGDAAEDALVPAFYGMWSKSSDLKFAVGINTPLGLTTEYSQTWAGRFDAVESAIMTVNINPTVAYRINEKFSIGAGVQIEYMDVTLSNMSGGGLAEVTGDDWGFGVTLGALYEFSDETRVGFGYRSQVSHVLDGELTVGGVFASNAEADFTAPDLLTAGVYHDYSDQFAVMAELGWTRWSTFDELRVVNDSGTTLALTPEDWEDVWFVALGATWKPNDQWTVRGGIAYDQTPVPDATRTPRLADEDRTWIAVGTQYKASPKFTVDAGYTHIFVKDSTVNLPDRGFPAAPPALTATYESSIDILTVQGTFRF